MIDDADVFAANFIRLFVCFVAGACLRPLGEFTAQFRIEVGQGRFASLLQRLLYFSRRCLPYISQCPGDTARVGGPLRQPFSLFPIGAHRVGDLRQIADTRRVDEC